MLLCPENFSKFMSCVGVGNSALYTKQPVHEKGLCTKHPETACTQPRASPAYCVRLPRTTWQ